MANFIPKITYVELGTGTPKSFTFDSVPDGDPVRSKTNHNVKHTRSTNGTRQSQFTYNIERETKQFTFQSETLKDKMQDFIDNHASRGGDFKYFVHSDEVEFEVFEYPDRSFKLGRPIPNGAGDFEYDFKFNIERVK